MSDKIVLTLHQIGWNEFNKDLVADGIFTKPKAGPPSEMRQTLQQAVDLKRKERDVLARRAGLLKGLYDQAFTALRKLIAESDPQSEKEAREFAASYARLSSEVEFFGSALEFAEVRRQALDTRIANDQNYLRGVP